MARKKPKGALFEWEEAMVTAYYDERCHEVLDPLYEKFTAWHAGEVTHADLDAAIHFVHREMQKIYGLFARPRSQVAVDVVADRGWYERWLAEHPLPDDEE